MQTRLTDFITLQKEVLELRAENKRLRELVLDELVKQAQELNMGYDKPAPTTQKE